MPLQLRLFGWSDRNRKMILRDKAVMIVVTNEWVARENSEDIQTLWTIGYLGSVEGHEWAREIP